MIKHGLRILVVSAALLLPLGATTASAGNAPAGCYKDQGTIVCPSTDTPGNSPADGPNQYDTTTTKKGSISSSHDPATTCNGPPGQCN